MYVKHGKLNHEKFSHLFEFYNMDYTFWRRLCFALMKRPMGKKRHDIK